jgi:hypothetical protein
MGVLIRVVLRYSHMWTDCKVIGLLIGPSDSF